MRHKKTLIMGLTLSALAMASVSKPSKASTEQHNVLIAFEFKGSRVAYDVGVLSALYPHLDARRIGKTIFTGSSSGSILAAFFACNGLSSATIAKAEALIPAFDPNVIGEHDPLKFIKVLSGVDPSQDASVLDHVLLLATNQGTCVPKHPFAIVASNDEILRDTLPGTRRPALSKTLNFANMDVIDIATQKNLGKGCTYFTNTAGAEYLTKVPAERRLCDIRLVSDADELLLAIHASIAEPTYFKAIDEPNPSAFIEREPPSGRRYQGGLPLPAVVQDFKIADPRLVSVASGGNYFPRAVNRWLANMYLVDINRRWVETNWWYDFKVQAGHDQWAAINRSNITTSELIKLGRDTFANCFKANTCAPKLMLEPSGGSSDLDGAPIAPFTKRGLKMILKSESRP
jgi:hypothetical protein